MARKGAYRVTVAPASRGSKIAARQAVAIDPPKNAPNDPTAKQGSTLGIQALLGRLEKLRIGAALDHDNTRAEDFRGLFIQGD